MKGRPFIGGNQNKQPDEARVDQSPAADEGDQSTRNEAEGEAQS